MTKTSNNGIRIWAVLVTLVLIAGIIAGVVLWQKDYISFGKPAESAAVGTVVDENGDEMNSEEVYKMPRAMTFTPSARGATPETTVQIQAVLELADPDSPATNGLVTWSIAFANPSDEWASGKSTSDYVTVEDTTALTTTVTFKAAFAEQMIITVTSQDNTAISATCTVDCAQKLESTYVTYAIASGLEGDAALVLNGTSGTESNWATLKTDLDTSAQKAAEFTYNATEVYTIADEYTAMVTIAPSAELLAAAQEIDPSATSGSYDATAGIVPNESFFAQLLGEAFATESNLYALGKKLEEKSVVNPFTVTVTTSGTYTEDTTDIYYIAYVASDVGNPVTGIIIEGGPIIF